MKEDLNINALESNTLRNNKQFNQLKKRDMENTESTTDTDKMSDIEFKEWVNRVTSKNIIE